MKAAAARDEGAFAGLLGDAKVWDVDEAATGDVLMLEIPKGRSVSQEDVDEIEAFLARAQDASRSTRPARPISSTKRSSGCGGKKPKRSRSLLWAPGDVQAAIASSARAIYPAAAGLRCERSGHVQRD